MCPAHLPTAPRRADHVRNGALLIDAARTAFAEQGAGASINEIVHRAGLSKGTFFRHFATKEVLVQALMADRLIRLEAIAREVNASHEPGWSALSLMMERFLEAVADDRSFAEFLGEGHLTQDPPDIQRARERVHGEVDCALVAAQAKGEVRLDVETTDFPAIVLMITRSTARHHPSHPHLGRRYLRLFLDGVRTGTPSDLGATLSRAEREPIQRPCQTKHSQLQSA